VDIDDELKAGQAEEPVKEMHCWAMADGVEAANRASTMTDLVGESEGVEEGFGSCADLRRDFI
jgi:hypothetical protein